MENLLFLGVPILKHIRVYQIVSQREGERREMIDTGKWSAKPTVRYKHSKITSVLKHRQMYDHMISKSKYIQQEGQDSPKSLIWV